MNARSSLITLLACLFSAAAVPARAVPMAYVPDVFANLVYVVDTSTDTVVTTIPVGIAPSDVAISRDGFRVYVSAAGSNSISVIDAATNTLAASIPVFGGTVDLAFSPNQSLLYGAGGGFSTKIVNTTTQALVGFLGFSGLTDSPWGVGISIDGSRAYVSSALHNSVTVIDTASHGLITTIPDAGNRSIIVHPDGTRVYASFLGSTGLGPDRIHVIDTATNAIVTTIPTLGLVEGMEFSADATRLYIGAGPAWIDTTTDTLVQVQTMSGYNALSLHPDGRLYGMNASTDRLDILDPDTLTVVDFVAVGASPIAYGHFIGPQPVCGDGVRTFPEQCDDGNLASGDCCSPTCTLEVGACDDGNACTVGETCSGATCSGGSAVTCDPCLTCLPSVGCALPSAPACDVAASHGSTLDLRDGSAPTQDRISWSWNSGSLVDKVDFGSPRTSTDLTLCVIDASGLKVSATAPAGGTCGSRACWLENGTGYRYRDGDASPDGLRSVRLKAGSVGRGRVSARGRGAQLSLPPLVLSPPVTVRAVRSDAPQCWEASFSQPRRNDLKAFVATSD